MLLNNDRKSAINLRPQRIARRPFNKFYGCFQILFSSTFYKIFRQLTLSYRKLVSGFFRKWRISNRGKATYFFSLINFVLISNPYAVGLRNQWYSLIIQNNLESVNNVIVNLRVKRSSKIFENSFLKNEILIFWSQALIVCIKVLFKLQISSLSKFEFNENRNLRVFAEKYENGY